MNATRMHPKRGEGKISEAWDTAASSWRRYLDQPSTTQTRPTTTAAVVAKREAIAAAEKQRKQREQEEALRVETERGKCW